MVAGGLVPLAFEIPHIGGCIRAEVELSGGQSREESPLSIDGTAGEDVGEQGARIALLPQLVEVGIDVLPELDLVIARQVGKGLQHDAHDVDLLLLRDIGVLVLGQKLGGILLGVTLRGIGQSVLDAVQKRVD